MPLDRELLRRNAETGVDSLLDKRGSAVSDMLRRTTASIDAGRKRALGAASPVLSAYGISPQGSGLPSASALASGRLNALLQKRAAGISRTSSQATSGLRFDNAFRRAGTAATERAGSEDFSRTLAAQRQQQEFDAVEANKNRGRVLARQDIGEQYQNQGFDLDARANDDNSPYQQALMRSLFGLAGTAAAFYASPYFGAATLAGQAAQPQQQVQPQQPTEPRTAYTA